jgi:hypothetical protein
MQISTNNHKLMFTTGKAAGRRLTWLALPLLVCIGCSKGDGRVDLSGNVSWKGQPVPTGFVVFNPDVSAGNIGPQGTAPIANGHYDTRSTGGRGVTSGAIRVSIHGFDGKQTDQEHKSGKRLFMPAEIAGVAPEKSGTLDLVVPDSIEALR